MRRMNFHQCGRRRAEPVFRRRRRRSRAGARARRARPRKRRGHAARRRRAHPLGSTRASEGAGDGAKDRHGRPVCFSSLAAARWRLSPLRLRREKQRGEREGKSRMARVFQGAGRSELFDPRETAARPSDRDGRSRLDRPTRRPRRARARAALCRPRPRLRPGCGLLRARRTGPNWFLSSWAALG